MSYLNQPQEPVENWWKRMISYDQFLKEKQEMIHLFMGEYRWLSNFYEIPILYKGKLFPTSEHAYQWAKCDDSFGGKHAAEVIRKAETPGAARKYGQTCPMRSDWDSVKDQVMMDVLCVKYSIPEMKDRLLNTGYKYLVECTFWHDNHFGVCIKPGCKCQVMQVPAKNMLGKISMELRHALQNGKEMKIKGYVIRYKDGYYNQGGHPVTFSEATIYATAEEAEMHVRELIEVDKIEPIMEYV
jgi:ribA/ribD-fused uncharacterized protein